MTGTITVMQLDTNIEVSYDVSKISHINMNATIHDEEGDHRAFRINFDDSSDSTTFSAKHWIIIFNH